MEGTGRSTAGLGRGNTLFSPRPMAFSKDAPLSNLTPPHPRSAGLLLPRPNATSHSPSSATGSQVPDLVTRSCDVAPGTSRQRVAIKSSSDRGHQPYDPAITPLPVREGLTGYVLYDPKSPHLLQALHAGATMTSPVSMPHHIYDFRRFHPAEVPGGGALPPDQQFKRDMYPAVARILEHLREAASIRERSSLSTISREEASREALSVPSSGHSLEVSSETVVTATELLAADRPLGIATPPGSDGFVEEVKDGAVDTKLGDRPAATTATLDKSQSQALCKVADVPIPADVPPIAGSPRRIAARVVGRPSQAPKPEVVRLSSSFPATPTSEIVSPREKPEPQDALVTKAPPKSTRSQPKRTKAPKRPKSAAIHGDKDKPASPQPRPNPAATAKAPPPATERCCPTEVPSVLLMILDQSVGLHERLAEQYAFLYPRLCEHHRQKLSDLAASLGFNLPSPTTVSTPRPVLTSAKPKKPKASAKTRPANSTAEATAAKAVRPSKQKMERGEVPTAPSAPLKVPLAPAPTLLPAPAKPIAAPSRPLAAANGESKTSTNGPKRPVVESWVSGPESPSKKKQKLSSSSTVSRLYTSVGVGRPQLDVVRAGAYRSHMIAELGHMLGNHGDKAPTHGSVTNEVILGLLEKSAHPNADPGKGPIDVYLASGEEAYQMLESSSPEVPVVTHGQQSFRWDPRTRPVQELFRRMEDLDRDVSVQVPSRPCLDDSFDSRSLSAVRDRFLAKEETEDPWNILDLRSPIPAAILPAFLTGENCQLLPRLRDAVLNGQRAERGTGTRDQWNEWRDILEWVLLSEGGHNTSPHTDSHGLATWISVQEGLFGFGWMSRPTEDETREWTADPLKFAGGRWRFVILEPGQTVFFNSGTVHFVFRLKKEQTLALGGHVLQWSGIERWIEVVSAQMNNPHITNEDMEWSAPKYVRVVADLVEKRLKCGRVDELGGTKTVERILGILKEFDDKYVRPRAKKSKSKKKRAR